MLLGRHPTPALGAVPRQAKNGAEGRYPHEDSGGILSVGSKAPVWGTGLGKLRGLWPEAWMNREGWLAREGGAVPVSTVRRVRETEAQIHGCDGVPGAQGHNQAGVKTGEVQKDDPATQERSPHETSARYSHIRPDAWPEPQGWQSPGPDSLGLLSLLLFHSLEALPRLQPFFTAPLEFLPVDKQSS